MSHKGTIFYRENVAISVDFSAEEVSSDGAVILLEKLERKHNIISSLSKFIPDNRNPIYTTHTNEKLLKQRVFMLIQGYEDANDVSFLKNDPLFKDILEGDLASQPTISRFENRSTRSSIWALSEAWVNRYVLTLKGRKHIIIDADGTDDPTHGNQQLALFNGYYGQFMYNELFFHDGDTGQIILPVLRPGNSHSNKGFVGLLERIVLKIREVYPDMRITFRGDSGFSGAGFYQLADKYNLQFAVGMATNNILKQRVARASRAVNFLYPNKKHQHFMSFEYKAKSWHKAQQCHSKIENTGKGLNIRHFVSNMEQQTAREIYFDFYVKRGDASENRIKEVKNMCFSDRLSNHGFWANALRLFMSSMAYEFCLLIRAELQKTKHKKAKVWQVDSIRKYLLKIGGTIKKTKRRIYYQLSKAFVHQDLFLKLITQ